MENTPTLNLGFARVRKTGPVGTAALMAVVLFPLAYGVLAGDMNIFRSEFLLYVLSGRIFTDLFTPFGIGFLNQPPIGLFLVCFSVASIVAVPYVTIVRKISNRTTRSGHLAFAVPVVAVCVLLLSVLVGPFLWLIHYMISMGCTPRRVEGLLYTIGSGCGMLAYLRWAIRKPRETAPVPDTDSSEAGIDGQTIR